MGKKGKWFLAVRKVLGHEGNEENDQKNHKSKSPWRFGSPRSSNSQPSEPIDTPEPVETSELMETATRHDTPPPPLPLPPPSTAEVKVTGHEEDHAYSVALASAVAAQAAAVAANAAAEVARLTANARHPKKSKEVSAAIKIQTAVRGYQARAAMRRLRGWVRLKGTVKGNAVHRQTITTLRSMQTLARVQSQIRSRRIRMEEENEALLNQLQLKHERELEKLKIEEDWDTRFQSKEEVEARILHRQEATQRREKALAYAFSHQWKAPSRAVPPMFTDPANPQWGWSWLERWMANSPWKNSRSAEMNERVSLKSPICSVATGETSKVLAQQNSHKPIHSDSRHESPSTPQRRSLPSAVPVKKSVSPRGVGAPIHDRRRHSIAGPMTRDEESSTSTQAVVPHHLTSTTSTRAKSRLKNSPSPDTANSAKKKLSLPAVDKQHTMPSPGETRRHSGPPNVEISPGK